MTARDAMTPAPLTVTPRTSVAATLRLARDNRIGRLVGILTHSDLLRALVPRSPEAAA
ncbi:MAG TPA: CBS domain-containing protein [Methylomirabilota bacterium]|nr:CBS domain-containing protein [Methylomirabilota bacterium]